MNTPSTLTIPPALFALVCCLAVIGGLCIVGAFVVLGIIIQAQLAFRREEKRRHDDIYQGLESSLLGTFKQKK